MRISDWSSDMCSSDPAWDYVRNTCPAPVKPTFQAGKEQRDPLLGSYLLFSGSRLKGNSVAGKIIGRHGHIEVIKRRFNACFIILPGGGIPTGDVPFQRGFGQNKLQFRISHDISLRYLQASRGDGPSKIGRAHV